MDHATKSSWTLDATDVSGGPGAVNENVLTYSDNVRLGLGSRNSPMARMAALVKLEAVTVLLFSISASVPTAAVDTTASDALQLELVSVVS